MRHPRIALITLLGAVVAAGTFAHPDAAERAAGDPAPAPGFEYRQVTFHGDSARQSAGIEPAGHDGCELILVSP